MKALGHLLDHCDFLWRREQEHAAPPTNIQWRADQCDSGSILFFQRFDDGHSDLEIYQRYLEHRPFAVLITNRMMDCFGLLPDKAIYVTQPGTWPGIVQRFCDQIYPLKTDGPRFLGVTGTNGKTTTVRYLDAILRARGQRVLCIGTLGVYLDGQAVEDTGFTSPPQIELRRLIHRYQERVDWIVMEASSHALDQGRVHGIPLEAAAWTNFTQDHLDYHGDEAAYFRAKTTILNLIQPGGTLYTTCPAVAERLKSLGPTPVPVERVDTPRLGADALAAKPFLALEHNRHNYALATALARRALGVAEGPLWQAIEPVPGRFDCRVIGKRTLVIDFAHTPDALDSILRAIRHAFPEARVATVFGCGGDRDRGKRPLMGAAAVQHSDLVILTSDNPRHEAPESIIADILAGVGDKTVEVVVDRAEAIAHLMDRLAARPEAEPWVALIAGKGHERYIERNGQKTPYSDAEELDRNLNRLGWS